MLHQAQVRQRIEEHLADEQLLRRRMEIEIAAEKRKMQNALEAAITQLQNSQTDAVDRTLIANLLVSFFKRNRSVKIKRYYIIPT